PFFRRGSTSYIRSLAESFRDLDLFPNRSTTTTALRSGRRSPPRPDPDPGPRDMDASRRQSGIQQLLAAEQEAQQIVNAARAAKSARLKQAKEEAEREIAEYKQQMEAEFQRKVAESSGDSGANVKRLEQETAAKIEQLNQQAASISPEVIQMLLRHVTTVKN
ncbi:unnamed protein product, partial [Urochloa humidicola]